SRCAGRKEAVKAIRRVTTASGISGFRFPPCYTCYVCYALALAGISCRSFLGVLFVVPNPFAIGPAEGAVSGLSLAHHFLPQLLVSEGDASACALGTVDLRRPDGKPAPRRPHECAALHKEAVRLAVEPCQHCASALVRLRVAHPVQAHDRHVSHRSRSYMNRKPSGRCVS